MIKFSIAFLIILSVGCQSTSEQLPILSYRIDADGTKVSYTITYKNFINQLGESFSTETIKNKVFIANFFFTRCPSICPPMRTELIDVAETFRTEDDFMIVSQTIDPENDSTEILRHYMDATGIPAEKWQLIRSSVEHTQSQAQQFMTNFKPNENGTDFYHSSYVALVDKDQQIRGFYNVLVKEEVRRLEKDIKSLLK